jgi:hypothetical protein
MIAVSANVLIYAYKYVSSLCNSCISFTELNSDENRELHLLHVKEICYLVWQWSAICTYVTLWSSLCSNSVVSPVCHALVTLWSPRCTMLLLPCGLPSVPCSCYLVVSPVCHAVVTLWSPRCTMLLLPCSLPGVLCCCYLVVSPVCHAVVTLWCAVVTLWSPRCAMLFLRLLSRLVCAA